MVEFALSIKWELLLGSTIGCLFVFIFGPKSIKSFNPIADRRKDATYWKELDGTPFSQTDKKKIFNKANGRCENSNCNMKLIFSNDNHSFWLYFLFKTKRQVGNIDHIVPLDYGVPGELWNGQLLCRECNMTKTNKLTIKGYELLKKRREKIYKPILSKELGEYLKERK